MTKIIVAKMWGYIMINQNVGVNRNSEGVIDTNEEPLRFSGITRKDRSPKE
jgi:hypothetical protein